MTGKKNNKSESQPKKELRCDEEQYNRLVKEGVEAWNQWRKENIAEEIWLHGAKVWEAHLQGADLRKAHLENADLVGAHLENAELRGAHLENARLSRAHLENARLPHAHLENAGLWEAHLENANLANANLQSVDLSWAKLQGASFKEALVDSSTSILECCIDRDTDFRNTSLDNLRVESGTKYLLKYNIRRLNWEDWYEDHPLLKWPVKTFWAISDYGRSTGRVVGTFFILALVFLQRFITFVV